MSTVTNLISIIQRNGKLLFTKSSISYHAEFNYQIQRLNYLGSHFISDDNSVWKFALVDVSVHNAHSFHTRLNKS